MDHLMWKFPYRCENGAEQAVFTVGEEYAGKTCGEFLRSRGVSRRLMSRLKLIEGGISVNSAQARTCDIVSAGDKVALKAIEKGSLEPSASIKVPVVYEDGDIVVFDKPAGMPVHPSHKHRSDTLGNCFAAMYPQLTFRPVNRLDKDTSGLCAAAKNSYTAALLSGKLSKIYIAIVRGAPVPADNVPEGIKWYKTGEGYRIDAPIGRTEASVITRTVRPDGKPAVTDYEILRTNGKFSLLRIKLLTGRTHQIRVHFSALGSPLEGDELYGGSREYISAQALHCAEISFVRPSDGETVCLRSRIRPEMESLLQE